MRVIDNLHLGTIHKQQTYIVSEKVEHRKRKDRIHCSDQNTGTNTLIHTVQLFRSDILSRESRHCRTQSIKHTAEKL